MHSNKLEARLRAYEKALNVMVPPRLQIVVPLDGQGFTHLTKDICGVDSPYDLQFRDLMVVTCQHLMASSFNVLHTCSESDEISLLMHSDEVAFGRKPHKWISIQAVPVPLRTIHV